MSDEISNAEYLLLLQREPELTAALAERDQRIAELEQLNDGLRRNIESGCMCGFEDGKLVSECNYHECERHICDDAGNPTGKTWKQRVEELEQDFAAQRAEIRKYVEGNGFTWQDEFNATTAIGWLAGTVETLKEKVAELERERDRRDGLHQLFENTRESWNNRHPDGATIIDFLNCWLDQERRINSTLRTDLDKHIALVKTMGTRCDKLAGMLRRWKDGAYWERDKELITDTETLLREVRE